MLKDKILNEVAVAYSILFNLLVLIGNSYKGDPNSKHDQSLAALRELIIESLEKLEFSTLNSHTTGLDS